MKYKALLLSPMGLLPGALPATAASPPPVFNWSGFYVGANVGFVSDTSNQSAFLPNVVGGTCFVADCNFTNKQTATGLLGGVQIGYNFQGANNIVWGVETDIAVTNAKKNTGGRHTTGYNWAAESGMSAFGTMRLRIGYAFDRAMIYATGGLAYANLRNTQQPEIGFGGAYAWSSRAGWRAGYTVGGGAEFAVNRNWSVKAEALYYDLGSKDHTSTDTGGVTYGLRDRTTGVVGRVGLNYLFGR